MNLLVISAACIVDVNRAPFIALSNYENINLTLLIPFHKKDFDSYNFKAENESKTFNIILSEIKGSHPQYKIPEVGGGRIENRLSKDIQKTIK